MSLNGGCYLAQEENVCLKRVPLLNIVFMFELISR